MHRGAARCNVPLAPVARRLLNEVYNVPVWLRADSLAAGLTVHKLHAFCSRRTGCNVFSQSATHSCTDLCCMLPDLYHPSRVPALILSQPTAATISLRNVASMQHMTFQGAPCQIIFVARFHWTSGISAGATTLGSMTSCQGVSMMQVGSPLLSSANLFSIRQAVGPYLPAFSCMLHPVVAT